MSSSSTICVDANIIIRLTLKPDDAVIKQLWDSWMSHEVKFIAPTLLFYEVTNGLYRLEKNRLLTANFIDQALDFTFSLPIQLTTDTALHRRAHELASRYNLPAAYDAHYLALAERLGVDLWTTDARLVNAVKPFGVDWVKLASA